MTHILEYFCQKYWQENIGVHRSVIESIYWHKEPVETDTNDVAPIFVIWHVLQRSLCCWHGLIDILTVFVMLTGGWGACFTGTSTGPQAVRHSGQTKLQFSFDDTKRSAQWVKNNKNKKHLNFLQRIITNHNVGNSFCHSYPSRQNQT